MACKQIYASWKWQNKVLFSDRRTKSLTDYFLNLHNFDYINHYNNVIKKEYHNGFTEDNKNVEIIKELQRILDNGLELDQNELAKEFDTSESYISTIRLQNFPGKIFKGLNLIRAKRMEKDDKDKLYEAIENKLKQNPELRTGVNEKSYWDDLTIDFNISYTYLYRILTKKFKLKWKNRNGEMGKLENTRKLLKECYEIIKNKKKTKANELIKKYDCFRRTVVKYRGIAKSLIEIGNIFKILFSF